VEGPHLGGVEQDALVRHCRGAEPLEHRAAPAYSHTCAEQTQFVKDKSFGEVDPDRRWGPRTEVGTFLNLFYTSTRTLLKMQFMGIFTIEKVIPEIRVRIFLQSRIRA
jgi:hypothetical protein